MIRLIPHRSHAFLTLEQKGDGETGWIQPWPWGDDRASAVDAAEQDGGVWG